MTKKLIKKVLIGDLDIPVTSLEKVILHFQKLLQEYPGSSLDDDWDYDGRKYYQLVQYTEESDEQYQRRLEQEELDKDSKQQKEIRMLKELQEKYKDVL